MPSDKEKWIAAFEYHMQQLAGIYGREFNAPTMRAYRDACAGWDIDHMQGAFKRAIEAEKFCPTIATLKAYGSAVHTQAGEIVPSYRRPQYTQEQVEDIQRMVDDLRRKGFAMPWSDPLPGEN